MSEREGGGIPWLLNNVLTPGVDIAALVGCFLLTPVVAKWFATPCPRNAGIVAIAYLLLCLGISLCKRLEANPRELQAAPQTAESERPERRADAAETERRAKNALRPSSIVLGLSWFFAAFVVVMMIMTSGILESGSETAEQLDKVATSTGLVSVPLVAGFLVVLLLFPLLLIAPSTPSVLFGSWSHGLVRSAGVAAADAMILVTSAFWTSEMADAEPMDVALRGKIFIFVFAYAFCLMFYAPPRLAILSLEPKRGSFAGYAALLGYTVWRFMSHA